MSHSHSSWFDLPPFPLPQHISSPLYPFRSDEQPLDPHTSERSGRLAVQSPLTSHVNVELMFSRPLFPRSHFMLLYQSREAELLLEATSEEFLSFRGGIRVFGS